MNFPAPPRGIKALPWRLPILLYRWGAGWMLGNKFLLLEHRGRKTGQLRRAVLEIIESDPEGGRYYVVSGFGTGSDWYKNIQANPKVTLQVGRKRFKAWAAQLDPDQAEEFLLHYWENHPGSLRALGKLLNYNLEFSPQGIREFGRKIPLIQFSPAGAPSDHRSIIGQ